jgi:hypothetical protein
MLLGHPGGSTMEMRVFGRTGMKLSVLGFGCDDPSARSWNSSHPSRDCSQEGLKSTGGAGLFYCFATN